MGGNRSFKHNTMFVKLLLSLTAVAVITVILIASVTYSISADNSVQNAIAYNESILTQQQELIHKELTSIKYAAAGMIATQNYLYHTKANNQLTVSSLIDLSSFVEQQRKISPYVDSVYLYYAPLELVLTSRQEIRTSPISTFSDRSWLAEWNRETQSRTLWITGRPDGFAPEHSATSLLQKMPLIGQVNGAIVINLKLDLLFDDYLSHYHNKKGTTFVLGPNNELLYSDAGSSADAESAESLLQGVDIEHFTEANNSMIDDRDRIISYTTSELTGWKFVDITERSALLQGMNRIKIIVVIVAATYLAAAIGISFYVSRRLYRPLQGVISYIGNSEAGRREMTNQVSISGGEAGFIRHAFEQMIRNWETLMKEKRQVDSLLTDNRTAIKEKYLNGLIQGSSADQAAELLELRTDFDRFAVLILELEEPFPVKGPDANFQFHLFRYGLMEELSDDLDGEIFARDDKRIVILLSVPGAAAVYPLEQAKKLKQLLMARYSMSVTIAVSMVYSGAHSVRTAYEETLEALHLKMYIGKGEILPSSILKDWTAGDEVYYYPYELEKKLVQALLQTDKEECFAAIRHITRAAIDRKLGRSNIQQLFFQLSGEIMKTLNQTRGDTSEVFGSQASYADTLARAETLPDLEACILDMCERIIDYHKEKRSKMTDVTLGLATEYMDRNFNNNISVDTIAEHVQRSSSYLSRIFKETTGMTVNDYLIQLRMKRAMELLGEFDHSIEDICKEIGYANVSYFNKMFKTRTGLTPGQYRQQQAADKLAPQHKENISGD